MMITQEGETPHKIRKLDDQSIRDQQVRYLPAEIISNILLWIPAEILITFKSVCKTWSKLISELISDPKFVHAHLTCHQGDFEQILVVKIKEKKDGGGYEVSNLQELQGLTKFELRHHQLQNLLKDEIYISSSCDGLLLFQSHRIDNKLYLSNPVTHKCTTLPLLETDHRGSMDWKLIYDASIKRYKVVGVSPDLLRWFLYTPHTHIKSNDGINLDQTTAAGSWREFVTSNNEKEVLSDIVVLNNEMHCLASYQWWSTELLVCSVDLLKEQFSETQLSFLTKGRDTGYKSMIEVKGHLSITDYRRSQNQLDIWILQDRKKGLWNKEYTVACEFKICKHISLRSHPCSTASNQTKIVAHHKRQIFVYDLMTKDGWKRLNFPVEDGKIIHGSIIHSNSLVSWK